MENKFYELNLDETKAVVGGISAATIPTGSVVVAAPKLPKPTVETHTPISIPSGAMAPPAAPKH